VEQAQREAMRRHAGSPPDVHAERRAVHEGLQRLDVAQSLGGVEGFAIDRRKPVAPAPGGGAALGFAELVLQGRAQPVIPRRRRVDQIAFECREIGAGLLGRA
jgi:hypothetical protein